MVYTQSQLQEQLKKLPPVLQEAMFSPDIASKMFALGKKHGLTIDKIGFMAEETGYVILGFTKPQEFRNALKNRLEIEEEKAEALASEISREIFYPLREELKKTHRVEIPEESRIKNQESRKETAPPRPVPPPAKPPADLLLKPVVKPPEKPPLSELLPKVPTPTPESRIKNHELSKEALPMTKPVEPSKPPVPKPPPAGPPEPAKTITPKPPESLKPEVMPGGGVFAPPNLESRIMNQESRETKPAALPEKDKTENQIAKKHDPYREPIE